MARISKPRTVNLVFFTVMLKQCLLVCRRGRETIDLLTAVVLLHFFSYLIKIGTAVK